MAFCLFCFVFLFSLGWVKWLGPLSLQMSSYLLKKKKSSHYFFKYSSSFWEAIYIYVRLYHIEIQNLRSFSSVPFSSYFILDNLYSSVFKFINLSSVSNQFLIPFSVFFLLLILYFSPLKVQLSPFYIFHFSFHYDYAFIYYLNIYDSLCANAIIYHSESLSFFLSLVLS